MQKPILVYASFYFKLKSRRKQK